ncbi:Retrovirus-related Pol polyprotein from transposon 412 [Smittium mucronatum]|uniref:Retrovirus-related Pol polyprotein from transposon 412 n=1 Tax=Smittium mucronatum TaxID=133383 RepID=A0A1R0GSD2_9FUNG|nr:Retrovirus-related Pol polyprotein from transposon 412 [Smittium mucronatum]
MSVNGEVTKITEEIILPLELEKGLISNIIFLVLENCAVYILMGIDACQKLQVKIDYKLETISFRHSNQKTTLQLMSKENIIDNMEDFDDSSDFSENDTETESEYDLEDIESVHLMYAGIESELHEEGIPEIEDFKISLEIPKPDINEQLKQKEKTIISNLIVYYEQVFANTENDLVGIKDSEFFISVAEGTKPIFSGLRRYSLAEKENINVEDILLQTPMFMSPDLQKPFFLSTDASSYCLGAVIEQEDEDGILKPLAYYSRKLKDPETRYSDYGKEALAVLFSIFGTPETLRCDNGGGFRSNRLQEFLKKENVDIMYNISHQTEWLGMVERMNGTLRYAIARTCGTDYSQWEIGLIQALTGMRRRKSEATGHSPHHLMFGVDNNNNNNNNRFLGAERPLSVKDRNIETNSMVALRYRQMRDSKSSEKTKEFSLNELVLILDYRLPKRNIHVKTSYRYKGPYRIKEIKPHNTYTVVNECGKEFCFHASRIIKFHSRYGVFESSGGESKEN